MKYTAVIRTLGRAGEKYRRLLDSLCAQTIQPEDILVYIAEGYDLPAQTCGRERYIRVKKGMVAQRALPYNEVHTEWILMLDDDVELQPDSMEHMFDIVERYQADVVSPDVFHNSERSRLEELLMSISGRMRARADDGINGYRVMRTSGYSYNRSPRHDALRSQTNAGPCLLCRKADFTSVNFEDELWLDNMPYSIGDDQVMFYKMHLVGLRQFTAYHCGIKHLDAATTMEALDRVRTLIYCDFQFKTIFWHRFIFKLEHRFAVRQWAKLCIAYTLGFGLAISLLKGNITIFNDKWRGITAGIRFIKSQEYKSLPTIKRKK